MSLDKKLRRLMARGGERGEGESCVLKVGEVMKGASSRVGE